MKSVHVPFIEGTHGMMILDSSTLASFCIDIIRAWIACRILKKSWDNDDVNHIKMPFAKGEQPPKTIKELQAYIYKKIRKSIMFVFACA